MTWNVFNYDNCFLSKTCARRNFCRETANENTVKKPWISRSDKAVVNRTLDWGSLEITLTIPLRFPKETYGRRGVRLVQKSVHAFLKLCSGRKLKSTNMKRSLNYSGRRIYQYKEDDFLFQFCFFAKLFNSMDKHEHGNKEKL